MSEASSEYHLGYTDHEHERLIRQAARLAPVTEKCLREAGLAVGDRVLDLGSGVGDVAMLAARIVGPSGTVVGIERDGRSVARARVRAAASGHANVEFVETDIADYKNASDFDAAVGRFVLQFLPDPVRVLRSIATRVRAGGVLAFLEGSWTPFLGLSKHAPLWFAGVSLLHECGLRAGVNLEMGMDLYAAFREAGLPSPHMRLEMELDADPNFTRWLSDALRSVLPQIQKFGMPYEVLGDLDTLQERLHDEVAALKTVVPWIALVAAWCRKPS